MRLPLDQVAVGLALAASLVLRFSLFPFVSDDMQECLLPWYDLIQNQGVWKSQGLEFSNYPPLYLYLLALATGLPIPKLCVIKLLSIIFDYVLAASVGAIAGKCVGQRWFWPAALVTLFLPTVLMNSSLWGQCDAMYASGLVACVYYLLVNRSAAAMVAFGLAFALKPQAVFLTPLILGLVWQRRFSPLLLYLPAAVYVLLAIPAWLAGRPFLDLMLLYANQKIQPFPALTLGGTNLYQWLPGAPFEPFFTVGLMLAATSAVGFVVGLCRRCSGGMSGPALLRAAMVSLVLMPFVLPAMHERYFYAADALSVAYAFTFKRGWLVAGLIQLASAFTYLPYLFNWEPLPRPLLAVAMAAALGLLWRSLINEQAPAAEPKALALSEVTS